WVWCEYQDPRNLSLGQMQTPDGVTCGLALNAAPEGAVGQCMGVNTDGGADVTACPAGMLMKPSHWYDDGRPAGHAPRFGTTSAFLLPPRGTLDTPTTDHSGSLNGWAYDPSTASSSIYVDFYVDGPAGSGTFAGRVLADQSRPDVDAAFAIAGNHGFSFT